MLILLLIGMMGCSIGVKEKITVVYVSYSIDPEVKGAIRIATNKKIQVTVVGKDDLVTTMDIGGYYVVHKNDLKAFIDAVKNTPGR